MKILWLIIWMLFVPVLVLATSISYIAYILSKNSRVEKVLEFYIEYFCIPSDIIFHNK